MNIVDVIGIIFVIVFVIFAFNTGVLLAVTSFSSFIVSAFLGALLLPGFLDFLKDLGWAENVYSPLIVYFVALVVVWIGIVSVFFPYIRRTKSTVSKVLSPPIWFLHALLIFIFLCTILPQFTLSAKVIDSVDKSLIFSLTDRIGPINRLKTSNLQSLNHALAKAVVVSQTNTESINLNSGYNISEIKLSKKEGEVIYTLINQERVKVGMSYLEEDQNLELLAANYAVEIARNRRLSHVGLNGLTPEGRARALGVKFDYLGENLAVAPETEIAHEKLFQSPSHHKNIVSPVFRRMGVAVLDLGRAGKIVVQEFAN
ncbi:MAG: CAP domain-containing protein [Candidatus Berkelbacteria bacterium]|nr:CAP domain-containing protein [Candidatus Berkelbacteria bacterium]